MNISLKPGPIISIWLPGFALTMFVLLSLQHWDLLGLVGSSQSQSSINFWVVILVVSIAFVVGQFLDAARDIVLENFIFERFCGEVKWEFFFEANKESLENLEEWFYTWYEMDANLVVAIVVAAILGIAGQITINFLTWILMTVALVLFFMDAKELRTDTKKMIDKYYSYKKGSKTFQSK
ncbi:MAG: hypothetical protein ABR936_15635 [Bacteroidota bacterium]|jgi:hypothetical protein